MPRRMTTVEVVASGNGDEDNRGDASDDPPYDGAHINGGVGAAAAVVRQCALAVATGRGGGDGAGCKVRRRSTTANCGGESGAGGSKAAGGQRHLQRGEG